MNRSSCCRIIVVIIVEVIALACASTLQAQSDSCATAFTRASKNYDAGNITDVISILRPCVADGITGDDLWQSYRLLALSYLFLDDQKNADHCVEQLLRLNPQYVVSADRDPAELAKLIDGYDFFPDYSFGVRAGASTTSLDIVRSYGLSSAAGASNNSVGSALSTNFAAAFSYRLGSHLSLDAQAMLLSSGFTDHRTPVSQFTVDYSEQLSALTIPLMLEYRFHAGSFIPYILAGPYVRFLLGATSNVTGKDDSTGAATSASGISSLDRRYGLDVGFVIGAGAAYPLAGGEIVVDVMYLNGLSNMVRGDQRYSATSLVYPYFYVDNDFSLSNIVISVGYNIQLNLRAHKRDLGE